MNSKTINALVIEDDNSWQKILSELLSDYGLNVDICDNLENAINKLRTKSYRLAIVDLSLGGTDHHNQDGLSVLEAANRYAPSCSTILLTGYASVEIAVSAIQSYGAFTCLRKEIFKRSEFRQIIHQALSTPFSVDKEKSTETQTADNLEFISTKDPSNRSKIIGRVLLVEDDAGWRSLLSELLVEAGYFVHACTSYGEALGLLKREYYQLAVVDFSLANSLVPINNQDGFTLLSTVHHSGIPSIVVSGSADTELIDSAFKEHKAYAFLEKRSFNRKTFLDIVGQISSQDLNTDNLTDRELEVLSLVAQGMTNKEIASELVITINTVKRHLKPIFQKLNVSSRAAASAYAIRMGLGSQKRDQ